MVIWLCVKRAITAARKSNRTYNDCREKVAETGKLLQNHLALVREIEVAACGAAEAEQWAKAVNDQLAVAKGFLEVAE